MVQYIIFARVCSHVDDFNAHLNVSPYVRSYYF